MQCDASDRWLSPAPPGVRRRRLRQIVVVPGADCGMTARLFEAAGIPTRYITGSGAANGLTGKPDVGPLTRTETAMKVRLVVQDTDVLVTCDDNYGYGNVIKVIRTEQEFDAVGGSNVQIEDQLGPKRCGSIARKRAKE